MESTLSQTDKPGHRPPDPGRIQPIERSVLSRRSVPPKLRTRHAQAQQPVRPRGQRRGHRITGRARQVRLDQHHGPPATPRPTQPTSVERPHPGRVPHGHLQVTDPPPYPWPRTPRSRPGQRPRRVPVTAWAPPPPPAPVAPDALPAAKPTLAAPHG